MFRYFFRPVNRVRDPPPPPPPPLHACTTLSAGGSENEKAVENGKKKARKNERTVQQHVKESKFGLPRMRQKKFLYIQEFRVKTDRSIWRKMKFFSSFIFSTKVNDHVLNSKIVFVWFALLNTCVWSLFSEGTFGGQKPL